MTQPVGVLQVVSSTFVPGSYARHVGWFMPYGPKRKDPASRSSRLPKMLGESNDGVHSQSTAPSGAISAPVWQFDRNAYSAIGGNGEGAAALCAFGRLSVVGPVMTAATLDRRRVRARHPNRAIGSSAPLVPMG